MLFLCSFAQQTLKKKHQYRTYDELKKDMESLNADFKTDAEIVTELVNQFMTLSKSTDDLTPVLEQLEYYLHQVRMDCLNLKENK
jgi:hypothetical protein